MNIFVSSQSVKSDILFVFIFQPEKKTQLRIPYISQLSSHAIQHILERVKNKDFHGEVGEYLTLFFENEDSKKIVLVGIGGKDDFSLEVLRIASAKVAQISKKFKAKKISCLMPESKDYSSYAEAFMTGFELGSYSFHQFVSDKKKHISHVNSVTFITSLGKKDIQKRAQEGYEEAQGVKLTRELVNTPSSHMTPRILAKEAMRIASMSSKIRCKVFDEKQIKKLGMNLLYSVGAASVEPTRFILLEYKNKPKNKKPIVLVGKGITFDSGGMHLKPMNYIEDMKMDMAGAATVLSIFHILAKYNLPLHVVAAIPAAENAIGGEAFRPGDIITAYNGKTVEITNTDAEGRLVLADALSYCADKYKPEVMIDIATLTGACIMAFGYEITALVSNNDTLAKRVLASSMETEEPLWELPLFKNYVKKVKSDIADLKNMTANVHAGTIMGGAFLSEFVGKTDWAHLDIAGTAWCKEPFGYKSYGGTGVMIRLLWNFLRNY